MRQGWLLVVAAAVCVTGCGAKLPEPESAGAKLYAARCNTCHRVFAPGSLKFAMWKVQVERMQGELVRHGLAPLTLDERNVLLDYLKRHSG